MPEGEDMLAWSKNRCEKCTISPIFIDLLTSIIYQLSRCLIKDQPFDLFFLGGGGLDVIEKK